MTNHSAWLLIPLLAFALNMAFAETPPAMGVKSMPEFNFYDRRGDYVSVYSNPEGSHKGTTTLTDASVSPSAPDFFKSWLTAKFFDQLPGTTVVLKELTIQTMDVPVSINEEEFRRRARETAPTANPLAILLARIVVGGIENLRGKTIVSVRIAGEIDNRAFSGVSAETFRGPITEDNVKFVFVEAAEAGSSNIRAAFVLRAMSSPRTP